MEATQLTILGAGSVRCTPAIIASLATYFGERPLEIRFWDADEERLDLFDRFARLCFLLQKTNHNLRSTLDQSEALEGAHIVVICLDENCAHKQLKTAGIQATEGNEITQVLSNLKEEISQSDMILSLLPASINNPLSGFYQLNWPAELAEEERIAVPHQVLRYIHQEEWPYDLFREHESSPFKAWLNNSDSAEFKITEP